MDGSPIERMLLSVLITVGAAILVSRQKRVLGILRANKTLLAFLVYCALSLLWSDFPDVAFKRLFRALGDVVMVWIVVSDREPAAAIERLLARTTYILIPLSILLIKYYPAIGVLYSPWGGDPDYAGVTNNKNSLGAICLCCGVGALWRLITVYKSREDRARNRKVIPQVAVLAMIAYLFSRINAMTATSTLLMASSLLVLASLRSVVRKPVTVHLIIITMLLVSAAVVFFGASPEALAAMGRNPTLTDRTEVWGVLLSLVQNPVTGTGFESFWLGSRLKKMWSRYWWHPGQAHNGYLEVFVNLGWVGVALLAVLLITGYRAAWRSWRDKVPTGNLRLAYIFVGLVFNFTEAAFFRMQAPVWIFLLLALTNVPVLKRTSHPSAGQLLSVPLRTESDAVKFMPSEGLA